VLFVSLNLSDRVSPADRLTLLDVLLHVPTEPGVLVIEFVVQVSVVAVGATMPEPRRIVMVDVSAVVPACVKSAATCNWLIVHANGITISLL